MPELSKGPLSLRLSPGVHVLYGLNGVGKSRLLSALPEARFHFAVPLDPDDAPSEYFDEPTLSERLWGQTVGHWSIGHESELKASRDVIFDRWESMYTPPGELRDLGWFDDSPVLNRYSNDGGGTRAAVFNSWLKRLAFWFGQFAVIDVEDELAVADALERVLRDGHLELHRVRSASVSTEQNGALATTWTVRINAEVTPDQHEFDRYFAVAAKRCLQELNLDHLVGLTGDELDDEITQLLFDLDTPVASLMTDAVYEVVDSEIRSQIDPDRRRRQPAHPFRGRAPIAHREMTFHDWSPIAFIGESHGDVNQWTFDLLIDVVAQQIYEEGDGGLLRRGRSAQSDWYKRKAIKRLLGRPYESAAENWIFGEDADAPVPNPEAIAQIDEMASDASREFQGLLLGAGELRLRFTNPREWVSGSRLVWECQDKGGTWVALNQLSDTQRRLAELAIQITFLANDAGVPILVLDEPERGLHRLAELHLRHGLSDLARRFPNLVVLVASHSPAFLRPDLAQLHHVTRASSGDLRVASLDRLDLADVDTLGVTPTDLLQLTRIVVLVEGAHDEWVLKALFGSDFQRMGVRVMSMRGANKLIAAAEGQLLFDYTSAHLVVMLDNISNEKASARWNEAQVQHADGADLATIEKTLRSLLPNKKRSDSAFDRSTEVAALKDFCLAAIKNNRQDRITFSTLGLGDIEFYLDPQHFLTGLARNDPVPTWKELLAEHKEAKKQPGTKNFKAWLSDSGRAKWNQARWERAVAALDEIPEDLAEVYRTIERLHLMLR